MRQTPEFLPLGEAPQQLSCGSSRSSSASGLSTTSLSSSFPTLLLCVGWENVWETRLQRKRHSPHSKTGHSKDEEAEEKQDRKTPPPSFSSSLLPRKEEELSLPPSLSFARQAISFSCSAPLQASRLLSLLSWRFDASLYFSSSSKTRSGRKGKDQKKLRERHLALR